MHPQYDYCVIAGADTCSIIKVASSMLVHCSLEDADMPRFRIWNAGHMNNSQQTRRVCTEDWQPQIQQYARMQIIIS